MSHSTVGADSMASDSGENQNNAEFRNPLTPTGKPIRWGIVSTGTIARIVVEDMKLLPDAILHAVSSRSQRAADTFADAHGVRFAYGDDTDTRGYERLIQDPAVDVVYVATPHTSHYEVTRAALLAGKHVLCEKPLTINSQETTELVCLAQTNGLFLMEAVWSRFLPSVRRAGQILASEELGTIKWLQADMGGRSVKTPESRLWNRKEGGGSLMDVAIYPLTWALLALGKPLAVTAFSDINDDGVDTHTALNLSYASGATAQIITTLSSLTTRTVTIAGTKGILQVGAPLLNPPQLTVSGEDGDFRTEQFPQIGAGYVHEIREVSQCVQRGLTESPLMPLSETVAMMEFLDHVRGQTGLSYESDQLQR